MLGGGFSFVAGPERGISRVTALRASWDLVHRLRNQVLALRSTTSLGLPWFDATRNTGDIPDGNFFTWLGQAQYAARLPWLDAQLIARLDTQLSNHPLLGLEQFAIGGHATVRGYRENDLVRDEGVVGSVELRVPVWKRVGDEPYLTLATFVDSGYSFNEDRATVGKTTLVSVGLSAIANLHDNVSAQLTWAEDLKELPDTGADYDLQDDGIQFRVSVSWP